MPHIVSTLDDSFECFIASAGFQKEVIPILEKARVRALEVA